MIYHVQAGLLGAANEDPPRGAYVLCHTVRNIDGEEVDLARYLGKVVMIVNVASKCGFTPQYEQLESLYERYASQGFDILGFPANNFLWQEPSANQEIKRFCTVTYNVQFSMFAKINVRGKDIAPLYADLVSKEKNAPYGGGIKWNFTKFLVDRSGRVCARFGPPTRPDAPEVIESIERELARRPPPASTSPGT